jgi:hypothetical protein
MARLRLGLRPSGEHPNPCILYVNRNLGLDLNLPEAQTLALL